MANSENTKIEIKIPVTKSVSGLPLFASEKDAEFEGIGMGVLTNGVPYLTQSGVASLCGIDVRTIRDIANGWREEQRKPRGISIKSILDNSDYDMDDIYIRVVLSDKNQICAFPDVVCMAILEYYALISEQRNETARNNYRMLARKTLRSFVYEKVGYNPSNPWKHFEDRVSLMKSAVPNGYFCAFNESAGLVVDLIINKLPVNDETVPDISVGKCWSKYWKENKLSIEYGPIEYFLGNYPDYYRQSKSNPQKIAAYPDRALHIFRYWLNNVYLVENFPKYISKKSHLFPMGEKIVKIFQDKKLIANESGTA
jgi:hypothetical protein